METTTQSETSLEDFMLLLNDKAKAQIHMMGAINRIDPVDIALAMYEAYLIGNLTLEEINGES